MVNLSDKEEAFCKEYVLNGGNATEAWRSVNPNSKAKAVSQHESASRMANKADVKSRILELKGVAVEKAQEKFTVSLEQRIRWLEEVATAGLASYKDGNGQDRRENLAATRAAVQTLNEMLGMNGEDGEDSAKPLEITFTIAQPKGAIVTTNVNVGEDD